MIRKSGIVKMPITIELVEEMLKKEDKKTFHIFKQFRDYNTIRRNLREAHSSIEYSIRLMKNVNNNLNGIISHEEGMIFGKINYHHSIMLYAKWFKEVDNKTWLRKNEYFKGQSIEIEKTHDYIILLRDKYIAHNEEDILGGDKVILELISPKDIRISSTWQEQLLPTVNEMENFKKCIEIVHNKIDGEILPEREKLLINLIKEKGLIENILRNYY